MLQGNLNTEYYIQEGAIIETQALTQMLVVYIPVKKRSGIFLLEVSILSFEPEVAEPIIMLTTGTYFVCQERVFASFLRLLGTLKYI